MPCPFNVPLARSLARPLAGGVLALAFASTSAHADLLKVPGDYPTIQDAVDAAVDGDEVQVDNGTYDGGIQVIDKSITIFSESGDPEGCKILGGSVGILIWGEDNETTISGFTIGDAGRGIEINAFASATIDHCIIADSQGNSGMFMNGVSLTMTNSEIVNNKTTNSVGGGMFIAAGDVTIFDTRIENNLVTGTNAFGGGIFLDASASLLLVDSWIEDNEVDGSTLGRGGGLYVSGGQSTPLTIISTAVLSNIASERGGGLFIENRDAYLANLRVTDNVSNGSGAGLRNFLNADLTITNATIVENVVNGGLGGGIANGPGCTATFTNSIIVSNSPENFIGDGDTTVTYSFTNPYPGEGNLSGSVQFVDGSGGNYRLSEKSPAIDAGNTLAYTGPAFDLVGNLRAYEAAAPNVGIALNDGPIDMGAYEFQGTPSCAQDLNGDDLINVSDLLILLGAWGACP